MSNKLSMRARVFAVDGMGRIGMRFPSDMDAGICYLPSGLCLQPIAEDDEIEVSVRFVHSRVIDVSKKIGGGK